MSTSPHRGQDLGGQLPRSPLAMGTYPNISLLQESPQGRAEEWGGQGPLRPPPLQFSSFSPCGCVCLSSIHLPPSVDSWTPQSCHQQWQISLSVAHPRTLHLSPQGQSFYFRVSEESLWPCPGPDNLRTNQCTHSPWHRGTHAGGGGWRSRPLPCTSASLGVPELSPIPAAPVGGLHGLCLLLFLS